jgi:hypothetical protein
MELHLFQEIVTKFFTMEIQENPKLYSIEMLFIPTLNPREYILKKTEQMRKRLAAVIIRHFLKRQHGMGKILLYKIINHNLEVYMKEYSMKVLHDHYKSWYVITELEEIRQKMK